MAAKSRYSILYMDSETGAPVLTSHAPSLKAARQFAIAHITSEHFRYGVDLKAVITNNLRPALMSIEISLQELPIKTDINAKN